MSLATEQRNFDDERQLQPSAPLRPAGTDVYRGAIVILIAVVVGGIIVATGLETADSSGTGEEATEAGEGIAGDEIDPAGPTEGGIEGEPADPSAAGDPTGTTTTVPATTTAVPATSPTTTTSTAVTSIRPPSEVRVLVLNGAGTQGIAAEGTELLQAAGYPTADPENADQNGPSAILHLDGYEAEALAVAAQFGPGLESLVQTLDLTNQPVDDLQGAAVVVVLGNDGAIPPG